jgi:hypothetical protein
MANRLPIPEDFQHLVEKREDADRRSGQDRRYPDSVECGPVESEEESSPANQITGDSDTEICPPEQRSGGQRRAEIRRQGD